jgi:tRNA(fMet)-specific endonuclease VapC
VDYLIDTNFAIHRWRQGKASQEEKFIQKNPSAAMGLPWVVKGEFLRGTFIAKQDPDEAETFLDRFTIVWPDSPTIRVYSEMYAGLFRANQLLGPHDLWIAAAALRHELPLLTRNVKEFSRVPGLRIEDYAK